MTTPVVGFAGLSHLGLVSSAAAAAKGFRVVGFDADRSLVQDTAAGRLRVVEPCLPELLRDVASRLTWTHDASALSGCDVIYVSVDVPTDDEGRGDESPVADLLRTTVSVARPATTLVVLSQVQPGFTRAHQRLTADRPDLHLFYQVETLIFGRAVERALHPERFIVGCAESSARVSAPLEAFLRAFDCPILAMRYESAELAKIAINCFLVSSISTTNVLAEICERVGAEWEEIAPSLRLDARIGSKAYLGAGLGFGGTNLNRDLEIVQGLSNRFGTDAWLVSAWRANSVYRRDWTLRLLHRVVLSQCASPRVALWGLAYKQDTASTKNSPGVALAEAIAGVPVRAYDPAARLERMLPHVDQVESPLAACEGADALLIMTPWSEFAGISAAAIAARMRGRHVVDPYRVLSAADANAAGLSVYRLGAPELA